MTITLIPIKIEGYEDGEGAFSLQAIDEACAELTLSTFVNSDSWPELSESIGAALRMMQLPAGAFKESP